ncbi:MAG: baseplate J/gp47 family protein [Desulfobacterales bacterium]|nr:baseplate J/gp47 family protein [Desulfobacterales bacterium]
MGLEDLPDIEFCSTDSRLVEQSVITTYEGITGATLYPGDPVRLFLESLASVIIQQRYKINFTGKQNLLKYSNDDYLDHMGSFSKTGRLGESPAVATERFGIDEALGFIVPIDKGCRVSPDGQLMFETVDYAQISVGETHVDVLVQCLTPGSIGNGFVAGQVNKMVDSPDYVSSVSNITATSGGADKEENDPYRERIHTAPESFSVAGPSGAYRHWAKSAHQDIADVSVFRTSPLDDLSEAQLEAVLDIAAIDYTGLTRDEKQVKAAVWLESAVVNICPLLKDGGIPDQDMLALVEGMVDDRSIRPLTDRVIVGAPARVNYSIDFTYYISTENRLAVSDIQDRISAAADTYRAWQKAKLGRDINPARLIHLVVEAGAHRVEITSPEYTPVAVDQVAADVAVNMTYGGLEGE